MTDSVAAAVVAFDDDAVLERCIHSLRESFSGPIVIVDNHSSDDTALVAGRLADELDDITVVCAERNGGYAAGVNLARATVDVDYLAVMNADCVVTGDWVGPCVEAMETSATIGACCPTVGLMDGSGINAEGLLLHTAGFGFNRHLGLPMAGASTVASSVQGVQGTAFVVRTSAFDRIGGWYEGGFLYHEDVELSWSLRGAGNDIWHVPTPPIMHDYQLTMSAEKFFLLERNRLEMLMAHLNLGTRMLISPVVLATEIAVWTYASAKRSGLVAAKWRSYRSIGRRKALRRARRLDIRAIRTVSDLALLRHTQLKFPRSQTKTLFVEEATTGRRGNRTMPTE